MRACVVLSLLCLSTLGHAAPTSDTSDPNIISPQTEQVETAELGDVVKYVSAVNRATLNFACAIDHISVTPNFDTFSAGFEDPITQVELEDHLGEPDNIEWAHVLQMFFETTDSRGQDRQLGTLGGDLGEFLLVLTAVEAQTGRQFTASEVLHKFKTYLTVMSKPKFYFSIDQAALENFKKACVCPQLNIADPPDSKKAILLNATHEAASHGDEFFRKALTNPTAYNLRLELVTSVVEAFYQVMWNKADPLHRRIKFVLLKGTVNSKGFIMVKTPGYCNAQLLAPMISPELCAKQMGIYHGDAAVLLRTEMAGVMMMKAPTEKNSVVKRANELAASALTTLLADHQEPVYTVSFEGF